MKFGIEKYAMLIMKDRKRQMTQEKYYRIKKKIRTLVEKETCKYFEILEADTIKQAETKEEIFRNTRISQQNKKTTQYHTV